MNKPHRMNAGELIVSLLVEEFQDAKTALTRKINICSADKDWLIVAVYENEQGEICIDIEPRNNKIKRVKLGPYVW